MKTFSFIGRSGSGKTHLITRLVPVLKKLGFAVAVIKHCPHGFSLDKKGKDSSRFFEAGIRSVGLVAPRTTAVFQRTSRTPDIRAVAERHFPGADILLVEGGRAGGGIPKIKVLGKNERLRPMRKADEMIAIVSDREEDCGRPVYRHSQVRELAGFLVKRLGLRVLETANINTRKEGMRKGNSPSKG